MKGEVDPNNTFALGPGSAKLLWPGSGREFEVEGERIAVFRTWSRELFAVQADCPHQDAPLAGGKLRHCILHCPLHSWQFDLRTGACHNMPGQRLRTFRVWEEGGALFLKLKE